MSPITPNAGRTYVGGAKTRGVLGCTRAVGHIGAQGRQLVLTTPSVLFLYPMHFDLLTSMARAALLT